MAWYYGTYSCEHEGRVNVIGPHKDRQWKIDREFEKMCPECWEKYLEEERQKANEKATKLAQEMELPELTGSHKQIAWANTIRQELIEKFDKKEVTSELDISGINITKEEVLQVRDYILESKTDARYYIDNRNKYVFEIIKSEMEEALKTDKEKHMEKLIEKEKIESVVYPNNKITNAVVEINKSEENIELIFEKNSDFISIVKENGYKWDGEVWYRKLTKTTGGYKDRIAEIGNKLLNAGFPVLILDEEIREMAINGEYEEECTRWIFARTSGKYKGCFAIEWAGYDSSLYNRARSLPGSKWDSAVIVRVEHYKEVQEFARLYNFNLSDGAKRIIREYETAIQDIKTVSPAKAEKYQEVDGLEKILESNSDILEDLKDD